MSPSEQAYERALDSIALVRAVLEPQDLDMEALNVIYESYPDTTSLKQLTTATAQLARLILAHYVGLLNATAEDEEEDTLESNLDELRQIVLASRSSNDA